MKNKIAIIFIVLFFVSCTKDFEEINSNPNAPNNANPSLLLRHVLWRTMEELSYEGFVAGNLLGQYTTAIDFNLFDRHSLSEPQFGGNPWPVLYQNLRDNELLLEQAISENTKSVYEGPARILKAYMVAQLTDMYGDVPYSEALKGSEGNIFPVYDNQENIYTSENGILDQLDLAIVALENNLDGGTLEGDIIYNGDLNAWIRFAYSLKIKYLMRISSRLNVASELQSIFDQGSYIQSHAQNASFDFTASQPNNFRMANLRDGDFNLFIMSETAQEIFEYYDDPRRTIFYREAENFAGEYKGLLNGPDASQLSISVADYSLTGTIFREQTDRLDGTYISAWETYFLLAEAAHKNLINANPTTLYEQGVALAFEYWGIDMPSDYLTSGNGAYGQNGNDGLEQIITQKWIANILNGYEGWIEFRRTGFPELKTISASLNNNLIPVRMPYPTDEAALNTTNYNTAASNTNNNSINAKVWWDSE